jgi:hypothetical protein
MGLKFKRSKKERKWGMSTAHEAVIKAGEGTSRRVLPGGRGLVVITPRVYG